MKKENVASRKNKIILYPGELKETEAIIAVMEQRGLQFSFEKTVDPAINMRPAVEIRKPGGALLLAKGIENIADHMFPEVRTLLKD